MKLEDELERVETVLAVARIEYARIGAKIEGLVAERDALAAALRHVGSANGDDTNGVEWSRLTKDRAIVEILRGSAEPMRIAEIVRELAAVGRPDENYNGVSVYLDTLLKKKRVVRVAREPRSPTTS